MLQRPMQASPGRWFWAGIGMVFLLAVSLYVLFRDAFPLSSDEGIHLMWIRLIEAGYAPYSQVYITYPPLYPLLLTLSWKLWPSLEGLRFLTMISTFPCVVLAALVARRVAGDVAGVAAAVLFTLAPQFVGDSRAILGELPSVTWSLLGVWLALVYRDAGRRLPLVLSALAAACSLLTKILSPFVPVLLLFIILSRFFSLAPVAGLGSHWQAHRRQMVFDLLCWLCAFLVPFALAFACVDLRSLVDQAVGQRLSARAAYAEDDAYWASRAEPVVLFLGDNLWTVPLAALGLVSTFFRRMRYRFTLVVWLILASLMLLVHDPVRYKHFTILLPLLSIWAGVAVGEAWQGLSHSRSILRSSRPAAQPLERPAGSGGSTEPRTGSDRAQEHDGPAKLRTPGVARRVSRLWDGHWSATSAWTVACTCAALALLLAYCLRLPGTVRSWQAGFEKAGPPAEERTALDFIAAVTTPDDCLITDDMPIAYWSGRLVPPELAEVSTNRLKAGELTLDELTAITRRYDCQVVAGVSNRIFKYLPTYEEWVRRTYLGSFHFGEDDLYVAKAATTPRPDHPVQAQFGSLAHLLGYTLDVQSVRPGARLPLVLYWEALTASEADYTIFVQGRDAANGVRFTADHRPYEGTVPTTLWKPGAVIRDVVWMTLPADLPVGEYVLWVGMYRVDTMERLPIVDDTSGESALQLGHVNVLPEP
jgi:hypothetical protein